MSSTANETLQRAIGRMEGKMDALLLGQQALTKDLEAHDERIRDLEDSRAENKGTTRTLVATIGMAAGGLGAYISKSLGLA